MKKILKVTLLFSVFFFLFPLVTNAASLITSLEVDGIGTLNLNKNSWTLYLTTTLDYATISATAANDGVTLEGVGDISVQEGANTLVVKATDGTNTEEYTINISVSRPSGDETDGNPNTGSFVSMVALVLIGLAGVVLFVIGSKKKIVRI